MIEPTAAEAGQAATKQADPQSHPFSGRLPKPSPPGTADRPSPSSSGSCRSPCRSRPGRPRCRSRPSSRATLTAKMWSLGRPSLRREMSPLGVHVRQLVSRQPARGGAGSRRGGGWSRAGGTAAPGEAAGSALGSCAATVSTRNKLPTIRHARCQQSNRGNDFMCQFLDCSCEGVQSNLSERHQVLNQIVQLILGHVVRHAVLVVRIVPGPDLFERFARSRCGDTATSRRCCSDAARRNSTPYPSSIFVPTLCTIAVGVERREVARHTPVLDAE